MKNYLIVLLFFLFPSFANAQKVVLMEREQGVYKISCTVNGVKMKMVFDTGASAVSISRFMANYLYENDYLAKEDIIGTTKVQTADGNISNNVVINLRDIDISGLHLENVKATVTESQDAPLLLGQSAIEKLGPITIDGNRLIINNERDYLSDEELEKLVEEANYHYNNNNSYAAIEAFKKIDTTVGLTSLGYSKFALSYFRIRDFKNTIDVCVRWDNDNSVEKSTSDKSYIYSMIGDCYSSMKKYRDAIKWTEKALIYDKDDKEALAHDYLTIGSAYLDMDDYENSIIYFERSLKVYLEYLGISQRDILASGAKDSDEYQFLGVIYMDLGYAYDYSGDKYSAIDNMVISAIIGEKLAKDYCMDNRVDYHSRARAMLNRY